MNSIFELETGVAYRQPTDMITCHVCNTTFSPVSIIMIPTDLCAYYSGTYKRMCAVYFESDNVCNHVMFSGKWGCVFMGDVEALPLTILSKFEDVLLQQPDNEQADKAWRYAINKFKESRNK